MVVDYYGSLTESLVFRTVSLLRIETGKVAWLRETIAMLAC